MIILKLRALSAPNKTLHFPSPQIAPLRSVAVTIMPANFVTVTDPYFVDFVFFFLFAIEIEIIITIIVTIITIIIKTAETKNYLIARFARKIVYFIRHVCRSVSIYIHIYIYMDLRPRGQCCLFNIIYYKTYLYHIYHIYYIRTNTRVNLYKYIFMCVCTCISNVLGAGGNLDTNTGKNPKKKKEKRKNGEANYVYFHR